MGRLTPEMSDAIIELYAQLKSYSKVADQLGINWKTVKRHVALKQNDEQAASEAKNRKYEDAGRANSDGVDPTTDHESANHSRPSESLEKMQGRKKTDFASALDLFQKGLNPVQVAVKLGLGFEQVETYFIQYGRLCGFQRLLEISREPYDVLQNIVYLYDQMQREQLNPAVFVKQLHKVGSLGQLKAKVQKLSGELDSLQSEKGAVAGELNAVKSARERLTKELEGLRAKAQNLEGQIKKLENDRQAKQDNVTQLTNRQIGLEKTINEFRADLKELVSRDGPLLREIGVTAEQCAFQLLNDNEVVLGRSITAVLAIIGQNPVDFYAFYNQLRVFPDESPQMAVERWKTMWSQKYMQLFKHLRELLAKQASTNVISQLLPGRSVAPEYNRSIDYLDARSRDSRPMGSAFLTNISNRRT